MVDEERQCYFAFLRLVELHHSLESTFGSTTSLITVFRKLLLRLGVDLRRLLGVRDMLAHNLLALIVCRALDLSPLLEPVAGLETPDGDAS